MYKALVSGKLKAAATDIMENETPTTEDDRKLLELDNFMATCHKIINKMGELIW